MPMSPSPLAVSAVLAVGIGGGHAAPVQLVNGWRTRSVEPPTDNDVSPVTHALASAPDFWGQLLALSKAGVDDDPSAALEYRRGSGMDVEDMGGEAVSPDDGAQGGKLTPFWADGLYDQPPEPSIWTEVARPADSDTFLGTESGSTSSAEPWAALPLRLGVKDVPRLNKLLPSKPSGRPNPKRGESWSSYIYEALKQIHPDTGISSQALIQMNALVNYAFERIASESAKLAKYTSEATISPREVLTAVRLLLPGELADRAVSAAYKVVEKCRRVKQLLEEAPSKPVRAKYPGPTWRLADQKPMMARCAGLQLPAGRIHRLLATFASALRVDREASLSATATIEYLVVEILELAGNEARYNKKRRISLRHVEDAISSDRELLPFFYHD